MIGMIEATLLQIGIIIGVILLSMTFHEAMHGFVAYWLGDDTAKLEGRLTLNPLKHIDPFLSIILPVTLFILGGPVFGGAKPVPFNPHRVRYAEWGAALVAIAGPLTNLFMAFLFFGIGTVLGFTLGDLRFTNIGDMIFSFGVIINLGFFIFNMIPVPPLDGSRVLYALAPDPIKRAMEIIEPYSIFAVVFIVLLAGNILGSYISNSIQFFIELFTKIFVL